MADLSPTIANVEVVTEQSQLKVVLAGEALTAAQPVYKKASDKKYWRADADDSATADAKGIVVVGCDAADKYAVIQTSGTIDLGATLTVGETYVVSTNAGGIAPIGDLTTGDYPTILGTATTAATLPIKIEASGVAKP